MRALTPATGSVVSVDDSDSRRAAAVDSQPLEQHRGARDGRPRRDRVVGGSDALPGGHR